MIYLDNAATTYPKPEVVYRAMDEANRKLCVNAGRGSYNLARTASKMISETKTLLRQLVHVESSSGVIFAPSITIAMNQIVNGIEWMENSVVYLSPYEHNAVARTINKVAKQYNLKVKLMPLYEDTLEVNLEKLKYEFSKERPSAVFCTHISNVTGYILPISEIFEEAKKYGCITVLDSAQSLGLIEIDARSLNVDIIGFAGHKCLYGPFGIGGFINVSNIPLKEFITGGTGSDSLNLEMPNGNETKYEAASTNIVAVAGLKAALETLNVQKIYQHKKELTKYLLEKLKLLSNVKVFVPYNKGSHMGIVSLVVEGYKSDDVAMILDEDYDIAVRAGYHCAPYIHSYLKNEAYFGTVRVGIGQFSTKEEIDELIDALNDLE